MYGHSVKYSVISINILSSSCPPPLVIDIAYSLGMFRDRSNCGTFEFVGKIKVTLGSSAITMHH